MNELKIGEIVELRGVQLMVVAQTKNSCKKCYFKDDKSSCNMARTKLGSCFGICRTDKQSINYMKLKDSNNG
jgi:hypothetical protein